MAGFVQGTIYLEDRINPPTVPISGSKILYTQNNGIFLVDSNNIPSRLDNYSLIQEVSASLQDQIDNVSGGSGFTPYSGVGIIVTPTGADYIFNVDDYISNTTVSSISANLQTQIDNITSGGSGFTPFASSGITIIPTGSDYIFAVNDYISKSEVNSISSNLYSIDVATSGNIVQLINGTTQSLSSYTLLVTTSNLSGQLQNDIDTNFNILVSTSGNLQQNITGLTQSLSSYTLLSVTNSLTGQLQTNINGVSQSLSAYTLLTTTSNISSNLQSQISNNLQTITGVSQSLSAYTTLVTTNNLTGNLNNLIVTTSGNLYNIDVATSGNITQLITGITQSLSGYTTYSVTHSVSSQLYSLINSTSGNGTIVITGDSGIVQLDSSSNIFTISHTLINPEFILPVVTIQGITTGTDIFSYMVTNRTSGSFDLVLSSIPTTGHSLIYHLGNKDVTIGGTSSVISPATQTVSNTGAFLLASNVTNPVSGAFAIDNSTAREIIRAAPSLNDGYYYFEDFLNGNSSLGGGWTIITGNSATSSAVGGSNRSNGILKLNTASTTNNTAYSFVGNTTNSTMLVLGNAGQRGKVYIAAKARGANTLFNSTTFPGIYYVGMIDTFNQNGQTDSICFRASSGGNWFAVTKTGSFETATNTSVSPILNTFQEFEILVDSNATSATFWLNRTLVATHTTNIPTGSNQLCFGLGLHRAGPTSNINCGLDIDWTYYRLGNENIGTFLPNINFDK